MCLILASKFCIILNTKHSLLYYFVIFSNYFEIEKIIYFYKWRSISDTLTNYLVYLVGIKSKNNKGSWGFLVPNLEIIPHSSCVEATHTQIFWVHKIEVLIFFKNEIKWEKNESWNNDTHLENPMLSHILDIISSTLYLVTVIGWLMMEGRNIDEKLVLKLFSFSQC